MIKLDTIKNEDVYIALLAFVAITLSFPMLINNIAMILLIIFWLLLCLKTQIIKFNLKSILLLSIPFGILLIGSINSSNFNQLQTELVKSLPFLILPLILFSLPFKITLTRFKLVLKAFVIGNSAISLILLGIMCFKVIMNGFSLDTLWGLTHQSLAEYVYMNAIYLSMYIAISLVVLIYFNLNQENNNTLKHKTVVLLNSGLFVLVLIFLSSRTVLVICSLIIATLFVQHYLKKENSTKGLLRLILIGSILTVGVLYINPVLKWRIESVFGTQDPHFTTGKEEGVKMRAKLWSSSIEVFKENWLFGVGSGDFKDELEKVYINNEYRIQYRHHMNSHNQYLSFLVSNGIIGLFLFLGYLIYPIIQYFKNKLWLLTFITIMLCCALITESYLYTNKGVVIIAFFITLMYKYSQDNLNTE